MPNYPAQVTSLVSDKNTTSDIFNGARCNSYSWSQGHGDLEVRVALPSGTTRNDIRVELKKSDIMVSVRVDQVHPPSSHRPLTGRFQHEIDTESAYWLVDNDSSCLILYLDKTEEMWWTQLLTCEQPAELGPKNYTVPMDQLDEGARMAVDKLIADQKLKLIRASSRDDRLAPAGGTGEN